MDEVRQLEQDGWVESSYVFQRPEVVVELPESWSLGFPAKDYMGWVSEWLSEENWSMSISTGKITAERWREENGTRVLTTCVFEFKTLPSGRAALVLHPRCQEVDADGMIVGPHPRVWSGDLLILLTICQRTFKGFVLGDLRRD